MDQITLDNFRGFSSPATFDLAPVTVLTGKNNSGKSSLIKAFLVLADYLEQDDQTVLRLNGPRASRHRISDWKNLANWDGSFKNLVLGYTQGEAQFTFEFKLSNENRLPHLYRFGMNIIGIDQLTLSSIDGGIGYQLDISQKLIDYVAGTPKEQKKLRKIAGYTQQIVDSENELLHLVNKLEVSELSQDFPQLLEERQQLKAKIKELQLLQAQGEHGTNGFFQTKIILSKQLHRPNLEALVEGALETFLKDILPIGEEYITDDEIIDEYGLEEDKNSMVSPERLRKIKADLNQKRAEAAERCQLKISTEQAKCILHRFRSVIGRAYFTVEHLSANRAHQSRLYLIGGSQHSEISSVAENFQRFGQFAEGGAQEFLTQWLPLFGIGEQVEVSLIDNTAIRIEIVKKNQRINLADLGFGTGQVLAILLHIAALIQRQESGNTPNGAKFRSKLILIEEPEANLHPQFQSLLAKMFADLAKSRYQLQFILETHSEYLIRNVQVLVKGSGKYAKLRQFNTDGGSLRLLEKEVELFKVYYFDQPRPANSNRCSHEMRLREDGIFMDEFGEGFLVNHAAELAFKLF